MSIVPRLVLVGLFAVAALVTIAAVVPALALGGARRGRAADEADRPGMTPEAAPARMLAADGRTGPDGIS